MILCRSSLTIRLPRPRSEMRIPSSASFRVITLFDWRPSAMSMFSIFLSSSSNMVNNPKWDKTLECSHSELIWWKSLGFELEWREKFGPFDIDPRVPNFTMTQELRNNKSVSSISRYKTPIILAALPVALALYSNNANPMGIIPTLSSGLFPIAFTLLTWGLAVQQLVHIRRK